MTAAVASVSLSAAARAAISTPAGLNPGDSFHLMFVTSAVGPGSSADSSVYDNLVATEAAVAGVNIYNNQPVIWNALVSTADNPATFGLDPVDAISRFNPTSGIYLMNGAKVADNGADLWDGTVANPISIGVTGTPLDVRGDNIVWTGTADNGLGAAGGRLGDPTVDTLFDIVNKVYVSGPAAEVGNYPFTDSRWIDFAGNYFETSNEHFYAFSSELTVPAAVPEPTSAIAITAIAGGWSLRRPKVGR